MADQVGEFERFDFSPEFDIVLDPSSPATASGVVTCTGTVQTVRCEPSSTPRLRLQ